jgi:hypothetical protein
VPDAYCIGCGPTPFELLDSVGSSKWYFFHTIQVALLLELIGSHVVCIMPSVKSSSFYALLTRVPKIALLCKLILKCILLVILVSFQLYVPYEQLCCPN